jgi:hypothetical protein
MPDTILEGEAAKLEIEKRGDEIKKKSSPLKLLSQSQPNLLRLSLGGPLPKLCLAFQTSDQDGHHSRSCKWFQTRRF